MNSEIFENLRFERVKKRQKEQEELRKHMEAQKVER